MACLRLAAVVMLTYWDSAASPAHPCCEGWAVAMAPLCFGWSGGNNTVAPHIRLTTHKPAV